MARTNFAFSGIKQDVAYDEAATRKGVYLKTVLLLLIAVASAVISPLLLAKASPDAATTVVIISAIVAIIFGFVGQLAPKVALVSSIIYSLSEGVLLGVISYIFEAEIGGIVLTAVIITATVFAVSLFLYSTNIIKVNSAFIKVSLVILVSGLIASLTVWIVSLISHTNIIAATFSNDSLKWLAILIAAFVLIYGAIMLFLDFHRIDVLVANGFGKQYEWTAALGLIITVVWIYIEVLRIIALFSKRD